MAEGRFKSRTFRRISKKTPGNRNIIRYVKRKPSKIRCSGCGTVLKGMPRDIPSKVRKLSKSQKRPERPYGGMLCSACARRRIISSLRLK